MQIVFRLQFHIPYFFSVSLKFQACYIPVQWGDLTVKNVTQLDFQKAEGLDNSISTFKEDFWEKAGDFFQGRGVAIKKIKKNKLKSEIFNDKKSL